MLMLVLVNEGHRLAFSSALRRVRNGCEWSLKCFKKDVQLFLFKKLLSTNFFSKSEDKEQARRKLMDSVHFLLCALLREKRRMVKLQKELTE